jgi:peroxisomal enoyl-CoA hydratase 2
MGFGGAIMHGLSSWNFTCHGILKELGGSDPANIKEFQARFASPVLPGDKLITEVWRRKESLRRLGFRPRLRVGRCV